MADYRLLCPYCGAEYSKSFKGYKCSRCSKPLTVEIEVPPEPLREARGRGVWRYRRLLPDLSVNPVSLGEGSTPIVQRSIGGVAVYYKLEYLNPTGSFKDRGSTIAVTRALELGAKHIVEDSSDNAGASIAAYGAAAGLSVRIYAPRDALKSKLALIRALGAEVVEAPSRDEAARKAVEELGPGDYYVGHTWNPFFIEGVKTAAYEVFEEGYRVAEIVVPVASGTMLLGLYKGFRELMSAGLLDEMPRLIGVQVEGYASVYEEFTGKRVSWSRRAALADGLKLTNAPRAAEAARAVRETRGTVVVVSDEEVAAALKELYRMGFVVEPTSATVQAALRKLLEEGCIEGPVLAVLTGSGLKNPLHVLELAYTGSLDSSSSLRSSS